MYAQFLQNLLHEIYKLSQPRMVLNVGPVKNRPPIERVWHMAFVLTEDQQVSLALAPKTRSGLPAPLDGVPTWSVDNPIVSLAVSDDGLSCVVTPSDTGVGNAQIQVTADAAMGEPVRQLLGILDIQLVPGEAVVLTIDAGAAEPRV